MEKRKIRKFAHLIYIPFTGVGVVGYRGDNWFKERITIFKEYTLKSLLNQENRNFVLWLSFRPQEENNPLTKELSTYLRSVGMQYVLTFNGLMYWDDKFSKGLWNKLMNCARVVRRSLRNKTLEYFIPSINEILFKDKNSNLEQRLDNALNSFHNRFNDVDLMYVTRLDSDDMLHKSYVNELQEMPFHQGSYVCSKGYIYNKDSKELAEWLPTTNPPFHTIGWLTEEFFNAKVHAGTMSYFPSHEDIKNMNPVSLKEWRYCVLTHNPKAQISTIFNHPFRGNIINNKEILKEFGL